MMDAYNLAVCFGPSVIDIPPRSDPVMCQANINSVIKVINSSFFLSHTVWPIQPAKPMPQDYAESCLLNILRRCGKDL